MLTVSVPIDEVSDWLASSVRHVLTTMFSLEAQISMPPETHACTDALVVGSIGFTGEINGVVYIQVNDHFAKVLAGRMLGLSEDELDGDEMVNDVIGELSNMVVGSVKSKLCDQGAQCVLTIPSIVRGQDLHVQAIKPSERRLLGFRCGSDTIVIELLIKPPV